MSHYKPYPAYKDSGVEWLGPIPHEWKVSRLGFEAWVRARLGWKGLKSDEYVDDGYAFLSTPDIKGNSIDFTDVNFITESRYEESPEIKIKVGDVLLAKDGSTLGTVNVVRNLPRPATVNSSIAVITPYERMHPLYLLYLFKCSYLESTVQVLKGGMGVPHLFQWDINKFKIPLPSFLEQSSIAAHLDYETAHIDALIEKKTRFIELLREKRQALITHAVTKGLDPNVKMKDSGVEWLGEVPEHWVVSRLGHFASVENGSTPSRESADFWENGTVPWLGSGEVNQVHVTEATELITELALRVCSLRLLPQDTVVVGMVGQGKTRGLAAILKMEAAINQNMAAICSGPRLRPMFLLFFFGAAYEWVRESGRGSNQAALNCELLSEMRIALPPISEQEGVVRLLVTNNERVDELINKTERSIELLKERRSALITAAVTGQIDLRKSA
jgi:type I restriction enzyme S subunit